MYFLVPALISVLVGGGVAAAVVVPTVTSAQQTVLPTPTAGDVAPGGGAGGLSGTVDYGTR